MRRWNRKSDEKKITDARLIRAAERGATGEVKKLIESGANVVPFGEYGTPLHYASKNGFYLVASMLINAGAPTNLFGETDYAPLHLAARGGYTNVVELLLKNTTTPDVQTKFEKRSALHIAAEAGYVDAVRSLLSYGAKTDARDIYGQTPLHNCARNGYTDVMAAILEKVDDVNGADNNGWSPLHMAAQAGQNEAVKLLLSHHAYIDAQNRYGRSALHWACLSNKYSTVDTLLSYGANVLLPDSNGKRPSEVCKEPKISKILRIYENINAADIDTSTPEGQSVGQLMTLRSQLSIVRDEIDAASEDGSNATSADANESPGKASPEPPTPKLEDIELCYDSGIDDLFGQTCQEELTLARSRYKGFIRTVSALLGVMESKTDALCGTITSALEGGQSVSYVDIFKQLYSYLQSVENNLKDFRSELTSDGKAVEKSITSFMKKCSQVVEESHERSCTTPYVMFIHYVAVTLPTYETGEDYWRRLYSALMSSLSEPESEEFLEETDRIYHGSSDRIFAVLFEWLTKRAEGCSGPQDTIEREIFTAIELSSTTEKVQLYAAAIKKLMKKLSPYLQSHVSKLVEHNQSSTVLLQSDSDLDQNSLNEKKGDNPNCTDC